MKASLIRLSAQLIAVSILLFITQGCKKTENPIKFEYGTFPDSVYALDGLNSQYDDFNSTCYILGNTVPIIFSSNRGSNGGQFDLVQGKITFQFDQTNGDFGLESAGSSDPFYSALISKIITSGDDLGPNTIFSSNDGYEYFMVASETIEGLLDLYYLRYLPYFGSVPPIAGPYPITKINTAYNDAYIAFDSNLDSVYFCSDRAGDFDIYIMGRTANTSMDTWFNGSFEEATAAEGINSDFDDKCPFINGSMMVFTSDRPGGLGGFDLYYSIFRNGAWSSPVNFGPGINSSSDEYRPLVATHDDYTNPFMVFSSNRPGGKGGFDLYFTGINISK